MTFYPPQEGPASAAFGASSRATWQRPDKLLKARDVLEAEAHGGGVLRNRVIDDAR